MAEEGTERSPSLIEKDAAETLAIKEKIKSDIAKNESEIKKLEAEARVQDLEAKRLQLKLSEESRVEEEKLVANKYYFIYPFNDVVNASSVNSCMAQMNVWSRLHPGCDMEIVFHSPGGDIIAGMALFDFIQKMKLTHIITTSALGMAASMAGVLLQAGTKRTMGAESWLLIHEASFMAAGSYGNVEDMVDWVKRMQDRILKILAQRSKLSVAQIKRKWTRKDWWLSSEECLQNGFVDEVF